MIDDRHHRHEKQEPAARVDEPDEGFPGYPPLRDVLDERREFLSRGVEELRTDLDARRRLHEETVSSLEGDRRELKLARAFLDNWGTGYEASVQAHKAGLDREIVDLGQARVQEDLAFWRDQVALHKELREAEAAERLVTVAGDFPPPGLSLPPFEDPPPAAPAPRPYREAERA